MSIELLLLLKIFWRLRNLYPIFQKNINLIMFQKGLGQEVYQLMQIEIPK